MAWHDELTGDDAIHEIMYVQTGDPGAVGANKFWLDTTGGATLSAGAILKQRDPTNVSWTTRLDLATALALKATPADIAAAVAGLSWKQAVRVATTVTGTLATAYENGDTVDGVTLATGDRILLKNQSSGAENGIYVVAASGAPSRASDADSGAELVNASVYVSEGTANADTQWTCTTNATITVGSTALVFAQLATGGPPTGTASGSLGGTYPNPTVTKINETGGPTALTIGAIADGEGLQRSGSTLIGRAIPLPAPVKTETASYTLVLADAGKWVRMNVAGANNLTVPLNATVAFPVGTEIHIEQMGAGQTTIVATGGVTIRTPETLKLAKQYAVVTLKKVGTDEWVPVGYLEAL